MSNKNDNGILANNSRDVNILKNENLNLGLVLFLFLIVQVVISMGICSYSIHDAYLLKKQFNEYKITVDEQFKASKISMQKEIARLDNALMFIGDK